MSSLSILLQKVEFFHTFGGIDFWVFGTLFITNLFHSQKNDKTIFQPNFISLLIKYISQFFFIRNLNKFLSFTRIIINDLLKTKLNLPLGFKFTKCLQQIIFISAKFKLFFYEINYSQRICRIRNALESFSRPTTAKKREVI